VILTSLHVGGFGRLVDRRFTFASGLNVVFGPNESGKSTLANAIVATLYGTERRKELWRPWDGGVFGTTLVYLLADGERIEIQRDFDRDAKGLHVYDRAGNEISAKVAGQKFIPGEAHLGVPLDVFLNAACVKQQSIAIDEGKQAAPIAAHLARALDGGPREDAALGAIERLDDALKTYVGSGRARKNAPLRALRAEADAHRTAVEAARAQLAALDELRTRVEAAAHERDRLTVAAAEVERRLRSVRAGAIAKRLDNLREFRTELAELQADHAGYEDVADFPAECERDIAEAFRAFEAAAGAAAAAKAEAEAAALGAAERAELEGRRRDAGSINDATFEALAAANARAVTARTSATVAAREAAAARVVEDGGPALRTGALTAGIVALCVAIGFAIAHTWTWSGVAAAIALAALAVTAVQQRERAERERVALAKQRVADDALGAEAAAANAVAAVLDPLGISRFDELVARRAPNYWPANATSSGPSTGPGSHGSPPRPPVLASIGSLQRRSPTFTANARTAIPWFAPTPRGGASGTGLERTCTRSKCASRRFWAATTNTHSNPNSRSLRAKASNRPTRREPVRCGRSRASAAPSPSSCASRATITRA
jgi:hypothetical protein